MDDVAPRFAQGIARRSFLIGSALAPFAPALANAIRRRSGPPARDGPPF